MPLAADASSWVLVSSGELSGDRWVAPVVEALRSEAPKLRFFGAGGPESAAAGVELRHRVERLAVAGLTEALGGFGAAARLVADLALEAARRRPVLALLVDYPGAHLRLARALKLLGVPVLYYVAPQRWAWLGFRARPLRRLVDRLAVILPFEEAWFRGRGVPAVFVGHPLRDLFRQEPREAARRSLGLDARPALALLPGSREGEVLRHLPALRATATALGASVQSFVVSPGGAHRALCERLAPELPRAESAAAFGAADAAICAAGTATLELALAGVPTAVVYRVSRTTHAVARRLVKVPYLALPNLLLDEELCPELLQEEVSPERLVREMRRLLEPASAERARRGAERVARCLGPPGVAQRVAHLARELFRAPTEGSPCARRARRL
ncbi:MAG: lipid-A-disaccharide synthase [Deltaproteobacteria bacterium]|nr:lipid-A-disaccharide synthase [Deltaproteobacteria bacterium]